jgi:hypothetical protein
LVVPFVPVPDAVVLADWAAVACVLLWETLLLASEEDEEEDALAELSLRAALWVVFVELAVALALPPDDPEKERDEEDPAVPV